MLACTYVPKSVSRVELVLTLLLLEFGFGEAAPKEQELVEELGLNPSFTGIWLRGSPTYKCFKTND